ncbi:hypothetical protein C4588_00685 [Candidatus Parcubacteria bacterium]|nr:MAG: hypothetical protein C4588_00685 [Candidatus Parcubacteria bacterium]
MTPSELREEATRLEQAAIWARNEIEREFTVEEKCAAFDCGLYLAREWLQHHIDYGTSNKYIDDAFKERFLTMYFGSDWYHRVAHPLERRWK